MIPAHHTALGSFFWKQWSKWSIRLCFHDFVYPKDFEIKPGHSLLMLANHVSWWDGFWPLELNRQLFHKRYHVMMLEEELKQRRFMAQGGAFSIDPGSRSIVESLRYATELLENPDNMVLVYPQGRIHSLYQQKIGFEKGIDRILKKTQNPVQIVFAAALVDYFSKPRPTIRYYLETYEGNQLDSLRLLEQAYQAHYRASVEEQQQLAFSQD